jgi:ribonuclease E
MSKKMLINAVHPEEARVAIVEDGTLVELDIEIAGSEQTRGNIYKGTVVRVEPGLQAAFVDIGLKKLGFLQMGELHPDFWQWRDDVPEENRKRRPRIQEVLRRGQELIVQVEKGERDMKGAALTSYLSLPGRYMVLMPGSDSAGVSRKVENEADRKKLKEMAAELGFPEGIGYIIRTEALGKTKTELKKDCQSLLKLHKDILAKAKKAKAPALIYQELDLVIRTIRDYFTAAIDEVFVDSPEVFDQARAFFKATMPKFEHLVKLHQEKRPIFSRYQIEEQIDQIYEKKVLLKSGGSLIIEPTEALVSIDVNSGKSTGERGVEDTAFKTNMEAAEEAARQLRLRDLGGLIVLDFIDMRDKKHMNEVEKALKHALKADKARVTVGKISQFGMLEMSRQRIKQTLEHGSVLICPHCEGRGKVKSVENMAISFLRKVHAGAAKGTAAEVRGGLPLEVAYYLLNRKKRELAQIENDYDIEVTIKGKPSFLMNQLELELIRREKPPAVEVPAEEGGETAERAPATGVTARAGAAPVESGDGNKKKRRKRKKGKGEGEILPAGEEGAELPMEHLAEAIVETAEGVAQLEEAEAIAEGKPEEHKKKRRRRRRRGKGGTAEGVAMEMEAEVSGEAETIPEAAPVMGHEAAVSEGTVPPHEAAEVAEHKKKKRRRKKKGRPEGEAHPAVASAAEPTAMVAGGEAALTVEPSAMAEDMVAGELRPDEHKKKRHRKRRRGARPAQAEGAQEQAQELSAMESPAPEQVLPAVLAEAPAKEKKPRPPRKKKEASALLPETAAVPAGEASPVTIPEEPKKRRGGKKVLAASEAAAPEQEAAGGALAEKPRKKPAQRKKKGSEEE